MHVRSCLFVAVFVYSFKQFRKASDQMANGPIETATQSAFWIHVSLHDVGLIPAFWEALILGCNDKALRLCLEDSCSKPTVGLVLVHVNLFQPLWLFGVERF